MSRHFLRYFLNVRRAVSYAIGDDGGSRPPLLRSPPRGLVDLSAPPVVVRLAPDGAIVVRQMKIAPGGDSLENVMKPHETCGEISLSLLRWRLIWAVVAGVVAATGWSLVLSWTSGLPRVSDVSLAAAAERGNTPSTWLTTFAVTAFAAFLLQWFVQSLISLLIRLCRLGPKSGDR